MCSMAMGFSIAAAATTTNSRFFTPPPIRLRRTTPLISPLHTSPLSLFHKKKLPPCVVSTTNVETAKFDAQRDFWYAVALIKDLDPNIRTSFTIALHSSGITFIQLLKENGQWIAFKENSVHCPLRWPVQGCSRCSSGSSDGRAAQSPSACDTRFPTMESEGVLYVQQRVRFTQLPSDKPTSKNDHVIEKRQADKPANDHDRGSPPGEIPSVGKPPQDRLESTTCGEKPTHLNHFAVASLAVKGTLKFFVENLPKDLIKETTFEFPVKQKGDPVNKKSTIDAPKPLVIGALQFLCLGALHLLFQNKEIIIPWFQELCKKIIHLFADFLKEYFKKTLKSWSENILSALISKYLVKPILGVFLVLFAVKKMSKKNDDETTTK